MKKLLIFLMPTLALLYGCNPDGPDLKNTPHASIRILTDSASYEPDGSTGQQVGHLGNREIHENTQWRQIHLLANSDELGRMVSARLGDAEKDLWHDKKPVIKLEKQSLIAKIYCPTTDRTLSAKLANLYADEMIAANQMQNGSELLVMIQNLQERVKKQDEKVKALETRLAVLSQRGASFKQREMQLSEQLNALKISLAKAKKHMDSLAAAGDISGEELKAAKENYETIENNVEATIRERAALSQKAIEEKALEREKNAAQELHRELASQLNRRLSEVNQIPPSWRQIEFARP